MPPFHTVSLWNPKDGALFLRGGLAFGFYRPLPWFTYPSAGAAGRPLAGTACAYRGDAAVHRTRELPRPRTGVPKVPFGACRGFLLDSLTPLESNMYRIFLSGWLNLGLINKHDS